MTLTQRFAVDPDPPVKGQSYTVDYSFPDGVTSVEITITYNPGSCSSEHTLTPENTPMTFTAPDAKASITIETKNGGSLPYSKDLQNPETAS